jgi:uncharacterized protein (TIGR02099 family)
MWRRRLHRGARALGWTAGVLVIVLAVLAALTQLLLPLAAQHPQWVAAQLSQRLQRPVSFASLEGRWTAAGPLFVMHGVTVGAAPGESGSALQLPESELRLDFGSWLLPSRHLLNLHVRGLQLDLARDAHGDWRVNGIGVAGGTNPQPLSLGRLSVDLWLADLRIAISDATSGKHYVLLAEQLRLSHQGRWVRVGGTVRRERVAAALHVVGRFREDGAAGQLWLGGDDVQLQPLLDGVVMDGYVAQRGNGRLAAWLDWRHGRLIRSVARFDLEQLAVRGPGNGSASVTALHGLAGVRRTDDGYELRWAGDDGSALALNLHRANSPQLRVGVAARDLQLSPWLPWLALKPGLPAQVAQWLGSGHPRGELSRAAVRWSRADGLQAVDLAFKNLGIDPVGKLPGVSGLHGELRGDAGALSLELPPQPATLQFPQLFRQPLVLSKLGGTLAGWPQDGDWHLGVDALDFVGAGYAGTARGELTLPAQGGAPFLELYAALERADVTAAKLFWPLGVMSPNTMAWLDRGLLAGRVEQAQVLLRGDLAEWPFRHNEGRFEARAVIDDLTLDYGEGWPHAEGVDAVASFVNTGMLVEASAGQSLGVQAERAVAVIPDFGAGLLDLNVQGHGSGASLLEFVRKSPIGSQQADTLGKLGLGGSGTFDFHLALPLEKTEDMRLSGTAQLKNADFTAPAWNLKLDKLSGPLRFDARGVQLGPLDTTFHGQASTLELAIAAANSDPATVLSARLRGSYRIDELVQGYPSLSWLGALADGRSDFTVGFALTHVAGSAALASNLSVDSPLSGIALQLPAPLDKAAASSLPLHLTLSLPTDNSDVRVALGQVLRARLRLGAGAQQPLAGTLAFGSQMPDTLPPRDLRIRGQARQLDVTGWVQRVVGGSSGTGPGLESIDVGAERTTWFGRPLGAMKIQAKPQPDGLSLDVSGETLAGNFSVPARELGKRGVTMRLQRLYWPKDIPAEPAAGGRAPIAAVADAVNAPADAVVLSAVVPPVADPANTGINPAALPPFHLWVGDLRLGDAKLGEARVETWPTAEGLHIEQLRALSSRVQITGSGDWNGNANASHTHMRIGFSAEDLGAMLSALGYKGLVDGGKTQDQLDASWPGAPSSLSLANMTGTLSVHVSDGRIPEATAGVGRLLGLVSLAELPRRLTLDFGDVFGKGLGFDAIAGDFHLADGNATTTNLTITGASANISITGRTGLRARDYDQRVHVVPHVGNSLPLVGAVVGGPIGAAAGLAVQGLLGKGMNRAASASYRVTGSWDKPVMTLVEEHDMLPRPAPLLPARASSVPPPPASLALPAAASSTGH